MVVDAASVPIDAAPAPVDAAAPAVDAAEPDAAAALPPTPYRVRLPAISADGRTLAVDRAFVDARDRAIEQVDFLAVPGLRRQARLAAATSYWEPTADDDARRARLVAQVDARLAAGDYRPLAWLEAEPSNDPRTARWRTPLLDADYDVATGRLALRRAGAAPLVLTLPAQRIRCAQLSPVDPARATQPPWQVVLGYDDHTRLVLVASGYQDDHDVCGVRSSQRVVRLP